MRKKEMQEAINRSLSGLQEDPWLAQRILASEKGEEPMKKKPLSLVLVVFMLFSLTAAACAATAVYRTITINQKGEMIEEEEIQPEVTPTPKPVSDEEITWDQEEQAYLDNAPEDQYVQVMIEGSGSSREPKRTVFLESEFNALLDGYDYLTRPAFIPEGYHFERATMLLGCDKAGEYLAEEFRQEGQVYFARYSIAAGYEVVIGYDVTYRNEEGQYLNIYDALHGYAAGDEHLFSFPKEYDYHSIELPGMEYSIGIAGDGWNHLNMMRSLSSPILCRQYPDKYKRDFPDRLPGLVTYQSERIDVTSNSIDIDVLTSMYESRCSSPKEQ